MERIVILGAQGQLGRAFCGLPWLKGLMYPHPPEIIPADLPRVDLTRIESLESFMTDAQPDALINCAAYTNVEGAQDEPDLCRRVNVEGPGHLGRLCAGSGSTLVHVSTDYVFNGDKTTDYTEEDPTGGLSVYGRSKADGEENEGGEFVHDDSPTCRSRRLRRRRDWQDPRRTRS